MYYSALGCLGFHPKGSTFCHSRYVKVGLAHLFCASQRPLKAMSSFGICKILPTQFSFLRLIKFKIIINIKKIYFKIIIENQISLKKEITIHQKYQT